MMNLHQAAKAGNLDRMLMLLSDQQNANERALNRLENGYTPLMLAAESPKAGVEMVSLLLEAGAHWSIEIQSTSHGSMGVLAIALNGGDPAKVQRIGEAGAPVRYVRTNGHNALLDAVYGRNIFSDERLLDLLRLLIGWNVDLDAESNCGETGLRVLSRIGRFDAVQLLVLAGADDSSLLFSPLMQAVISGNAGDVEARLGSGISLEERDYWSRTAWILAVQSGSIPITELLERAGADTATVGRCAKPAICHAIDCDRKEMVRWLLDRGHDINQRDEFDRTPLTYAVEGGNVTMVDLLISAGADIDATSDGASVLADAIDANVIRTLLHVGANPDDLSKEGKRALLGFPMEPDVDRLTASKAEYESGRDRRFGAANPELQNVPFWTAMVESGANAYQAMQHYGDGRGLQREPVWCADRFGQSITFLPDGRVVLVGGEHEDSYDPNFCIYNDVVVQNPDGEIEIYGYPEDVFPPTDFHTATLVENRVWLIGSLGYFDKRHPGMTQVCTLNTDDLSIREVQTSGEAPGWISRHRAVQIGSKEIEVFGGKLIVKNGDKEDYIDNLSVHRLNLTTLAWRRIHGEHNKINATEI